MSENEILVADQVTENTENTVEEIPAVKMYSQDEVDAIVGKAKARAKAKIEKDYQRKYGRLEGVLKAGTGKESIEEMSDTFEEFYRKKGITIPTEPTYSAKEIDVLARAEAQDIINAGFDDVVEEVDRLTAVGAANMTAKEKAMFKVLAEHRQNAERVAELKKLGVTEDVYNSKEFNDFAGMFRHDIPITEVYKQYAKNQPKKEIKSMGSMKNNNSGDNGVKDFYTRDEALKFTKKDFDENPALFAAVEKSMLKWK